MFRPIAVPGHDTLSHIMRTVRYGILPTFHRDLQNFMLKSLATQCTVQCALKVVVTHGESSEATAEWEMFDAKFSDVGGIPSANIFRFQHLM